MSGFNGHIPRQDVRSKTDIVMDFEHSKIHESAHWFLSTLTSLDSTDTLYLVYRVNSKPVHYTASYEMSKNGEVAFYENPTLSAVGNPRVIRNNDRNSDVLPSMTAFSNPVVTDEGTLLLGTVMGSDGNNPVGSAGGFASRDKEFIFKKNTDYLVKVTSLSDNNRFSGIAEFYESDT